MKTGRIFGGLVAAVGLVIVSAGNARALTGHVRSVDVEARRLVVRESGTGRELTVAVRSPATIATVGGKTLELRHLKAGDGVAVTFEGEQATKLVVTQAPLVGILKSANAGARTLIVTQDGTGREIGVTVDDPVTVTNSGGKSLELDQLRPGDGVSITFDGAQAVKVAVNPAALRGLVKSIDLRKRQVVLTESGTDREVNVPLTDRAVIVTTDGKALALKDLKQGDGLAVISDGDVASKLVVRVKPPGLAGQVKSIAGNLRSFVVAEVGTGRELTIGIDDQTTIMSSDGKPIPMKELKDGDGVGITLGKGGVASEIIVNPKP